MTSFAKVQHLLSPSMKMNAIATASRSVAKKCPSSIRTTTRSILTQQVLRSRPATSTISPSIASCSSSCNTPSLKQFPAPRRSFHTSLPSRHGGIDRPAAGTGIKVTFRDSKGSDLKTIECNEGDDLLSVAHEFDIDLEGACEGSIACSTCHVILEPDVYDQLEEPGDDENDMLDLAFGLTDTSRLGCQVKVTKDIDGMIVQLPSATRNMRVDGSKPTHH